MGESRSEPSFHDGNKRTAFVPRNQRNIQHPLRGIQRLLYGVRSSGTDSGTSERSSVREVGPQNTVHKGPDKRNGRQCWRRFKNVVSALVKRAMDSSRVRGRVSQLFSPNLRESRLSSFAS